MQEPAYICRPDSYSNLNLSRSSLQFASTYARRTSSVEKCRRLSRSWTKRKVNVSRHDVV